jgi:23S rRNA (uracil747-C5)-methyltransferase
MHCQWYQKSYCTSCSWLNLSYAETLSRKEKVLVDLIPEAANVIGPTFGVTEVQGSRSKAKLAVFREEGKIRFGFTAQDGSSKGLEECPLHRDDLNNLLPLISEKLEAYKIEPYDIKAKRGEIKYFILSESHSHGDLLLRFTLRSKESLDRLKKMAIELQKMNPKISTVTANIQPLHQAIFEGDEEIVLTESNTIEHKFGDVTLKLGPRSFFQVTPEVAEALYSTVGKLVKEHSINSFLDLYCGVGAFAFFAAQSAKSVLGIELSSDAILCAKAAQKENIISGAIDFKALDVEDFLKQKNDLYQAILVNPPRRGLNSSIIESIIEYSPEYFFYSSCNVQTLARDHEQISKHFQIESVQIFDMFPFTEHFETLIFYRRK